jgi:hypothetical protein
MLCVAMSEPLVQPQFRPTLSDLFGARWRALPLALRLSVFAVGAVVVALLVYAKVAPGPARSVIIVKGDHAVNFLFRSPLRRVAPARGDIVSLSTPAGSDEPEQFNVRPLTLPPYRGDPGGALVQYSVKVERYLEAEHPGLILRDEGRTRINMQPGYQVTFQLTQDGHTVFGRDIMLVPDQNGTRIGAIVEEISRISAHVPKADSLGRFNPLKLSLRSFRLGDQRPD